MIAAASAPLDLGRLIMKTPDVATWDSSAQLDRVAISVGVTLLKSHGKPLLHAIQKLAPGFVITNLLAQHRCSSMVRNNLKVLDKFNPKSTIGVEG
jgi:hypothetical protein